MRKYLIYFSTLIVLNANGQGTVTISPEYPTRGDSVIVIYHPIEKIKAESAVPVLEFTYSNFYELPQKSGMQRFGAEWRTAYKLPPYAIYATFVIQDGENKMISSEGKHYEIAVYDSGKRRVEKGYLYEGYSLSAQDRRNPDLKKNQAALFEEELKHYPDNYEAGLKMLSYKISLPEETDKEGLYKEANEIIARKFYTDPGNMGFTNLTTMGYLIMGENTRLDSLREVIRIKYPTSEAGYELRISDLITLHDTAKMVQGLEDILTGENSENRSYFTNAHEALFHFYAGKGNREKALYHLSFLNNQFTPYTPEELKSQAELLYSNSVALDTALSLARRALSYADTFSISLTRYFPETGYLPSFVTREERKESIRNVTSQLHALMALILHKQGRNKESKKLMAEAVSGSADNETLRNAGKYYTDVKEFEHAFNAYRKVAYNDAGDSTSYQLMETTYKKWKGSSEGISPFVKEILDHWMAEMNKQLQKEIISKPLPDVLSYYVDLKGNPLSPSLIQNKIVIMDFWATWCVPCMHAMPYMEEVYQNYKTDPDVVFMIVNSGSQNELSDAQNWFGNKKYSFPVYYNTDRSIGEKLEFNLIPATYIIDQDGNIRFKTLGFEGKGMARKLTAQIELLKEKK